MISFLNITKKFFWNKKANQYEMVLNNKKFGKKIEKNSQEIDFERKTKISKRTKRKIILSMAILIIIVYYKPRVAKAAFVLANTENYIGNVVGSVLLNTSRFLNTCIGERVSAGISVTRYTNSIYNFTTKSILAYSSYTSGGPGFYLTCFSSANSLSSLGLQVMSQVSPEKILIYQFGSVICDSLAIGTNKILGFVKS
jgi:uncharacterized membrane protein YbaN (DUF454 family)